MGGCGGCSKRNAARQARKVDKNDIMGGYKYLTDRQIKARLELYKRRFCTDCEKRYKCDLVMYKNCKESK